MRFIKHAHSEVQLSSHEYFLSNYLLIKQTVTRVSYSSLSSRKQEAKSESNQQEENHTFKYKQITTQHYSTKKDQNRQNKYKKTGQKKKRWINRKYH